MEIPSASGENELLHIVDTLDNAVSVLMQTTGTTSKCNCSAAMKASEKLVKQLKDELITCKAKLYDAKEMETEVAKYKRKAIKLQYQVDELKQAQRMAVDAIDGTEKEELRQQIRDLLLIKSAKEDECAQLRADLTSMRSLTVAASEDAEKGELKQQVRELLLMRSAKEDECAQLRVDLNSMKSQVAVASEKHVAITRKCEALKQQLSTASKKATQLELELATKQSEVARQPADQETTNKTLTANTADGHQTVKQMQSEYDQRAEQKERRLEERDQEIVSLKEQLETARTQLGSHAADHARHKTAWDKQITELQLQLKQREDELRALRPREEQQRGESLARLQELETTPTAVTAARALATGQSDRAEPSQRHARDERGEELARLKQELAQCLVKHSRDRTEWEETQSVMQRRLDERREQLHCLDRQWQMARAAMWGPALEPGKKREKREAHIELLEADNKILSCRCRELDAEVNRLSGEPTRSPVSVPVTLSLPPKVEVKNITQRLLPLPMSDCATCAQVRVMVYERDQYITLMRKEVGAKNQTIHELRVKLEKEGQFQKDLRDNLTEAFEKQKAQLLKLQNESQAQRVSLAQEGEVGSKLKAQLETQEVFWAKRRAEDQKKHEQAQSELQTALAEQHRAMEARGAQITDMAARIKELSDTRDSLELQRDVLEQDLRCLQRRKADTSEQSVQACLSAAVLGDSSQDRPEEATASAGANPAVCVNCQTLQKNVVQRDALVDTLRKQLGDKNLHILELQKRMAGDTNERTAQPPVAALHSQGQTFAEQVGAYQQVATESQVDTHRLTQFKNLFKKACAALSCPLSRTRIQGSAEAKLTAAWLSLRTPGGLVSTLEKGLAQVSAKAPALAAPETVAGVRWLVAAIQATAGCVRSAKAPWAARVTSRARTKWRGAGVLEAECAVICAYYEDLLTAHSDPSAPVLSPAPPAAPPAPPAVPPVPPAAPPAAPPAPPAAPPAPPPAPPAAPPAAPPVPPAAPPAAPSAAPPAPPAAPPVPPAAPPAAPPVPPAAPPPAPPAAPPATPAAPLPPLCATPSAPAVGKHAAGGATTSLTLAVSTAQQSGAVLDGLSEGEIEDDDSAVLGVTSEAASQPSIVRPEVKQDAQGSTEPSEGVRDREGQGGQLRGVSSKGAVPSTSLDSSRAALTTIMNSVPRSQSALGKRPLATNLAPGDTEERVFYTVRLVCADGHMSAADARNLTSRIGPVTELWRIAGSAFAVEFVSAQKAREAVKKLDGSKFTGDALSCVPCVDTEPARSAEEEACMVVISHATLPRAELCKELSRFGAISAMLSVGVGKGYLAVFAQEDEAARVAPTLNGLRLQGSAVRCQALSELAAAEQQTLRDLTGGLRVAALVALAGSGRSVASETAARAGAPAEGGAQMAGLCLHDPVLGRGRRRERSRSHSSDSHSGSSRSQSPSSTTDSYSRSTSGDGRDNRRVVTSPPARQRPVLQDPVLIDKPRLRRDEDSRPGRGSEAARTRYCTICEQLGKPYSVCANHHTSEHRGPRPSATKSPGRPRLPAPAAPAGSDSGSSASSDVVVMPSLGPLSARRKVN